VDAAHQLPDPADDVEKLAGQVRGDRALDAWSPRGHWLEQSAQPGVAAELYIPVSALSGERSFAARAAAVGQLQPGALPDAAPMAAPGGVRRRWPKAQRAVLLPRAA